MPGINPIHAIRYTSSDSDLTGLIAPPYDVLNEELKQDLLRNNAHNIVAIDLPVTPPKTVGPDSAYENAGKLLRKWLKEDVLSRDSSPAFFAYEQVFTTCGKTYHRRGMFANLTVEDFGRPGGGIHRHELTIKGGTDDRLKLMNATDAQISPIFGVFSDADKTVTNLLLTQFDGRLPDYVGTTPNDGVIHRCWRIDSPSTIDQLRDLLDTKDLFIADGHHRYTTALNYHRKNPDNSASNQCLCVLVALEDHGMIVLPTHRIICGLREFSANKLTMIDGFDKIIKLTPVDYGTSIDELAAALPSAGEHAMGLFDPSNESMWILTTTSDPLADIMPEKAEVWRKLDVAILQHLMIDGVFRPYFGGKSIEYKYTAELDEVIPMSLAEHGRLGIVMQATPLKSVCEVSKAGEVMPPKSTYFYPKLATGLIINPLT